MMDYFGELSGQTIVTRHLFLGLHNHPAAHTMRASPFNIRSIMRRLILSLLGFVGGVFLTGCVQFSQSNAISSLPSPSHPEDVHLLLQSAPDPYEPINRAFFNLDKSLFTCALEPVWSGYNTVIPKKARTSMRHFGNNITYPVRLTGNLLQGEWANAGTETKRFLINTTVGILGFSDPATEKYEIYLADEDIGQALGKWGWTTSSYLHLPIWGASSPRDVIGGAGAVYLDPASWFYGAGVAIRFNDKSFDADTTRQLLDTEFDPYALNKLYYTRKRAIEISNTRLVMEGEDTPQTQTLLAVFNRPKENKFRKKADEISVQPKGFRKPLSASVWMQAKPSPIAFVIPGLGAHRLSTRALALAEIAYLEGYHVVCFSNNLNWEFIQAAPANYLPGYLDDDLLYLRQIHDAINTEIGAQANGKPAVMGFSMGGWYTLNLAATSAPDAYSAALSINPPLDLITGLHALDQLFRAPAGDKNANSIKESAVAKLLTIQVQDSVPEKGSDLPFSDQEASYLIGLSYRFTLTQTIMSSLGIARSTKAHEKVGTLSWEDYYSNIIAPALAKRNIDANAMSRASNLRTREAGLTAVKNLKLVLTGNDFLLTKEDLAWFRERFPGERTIFTETGGHMGQLLRKEVHDAMREAIRQTDR
ncbi:MAG: MlaA family lipoprotein [Verrucomicrobiota bacterium]|jgi:phospholipid-binding lipoprotein MlaA|nr:MlaA family lipoprotein [Verrucomicrobiota bacterium]